MKKLIQLITFFLLLFVTQNSFATHIMGGEITYSAIDSGKFKVNLTWYRDCRGIALTNGGTIQVRCTNGATRTFNLAFESITDVTPLCNTGSSPCNPANTTGTGNGIEKHIYSGIIDFNIAPLNALANCTGTIVISASINARNGAITTGPSGTIFIQAELELGSAPTNNSPILTSPQIFNTCCDQPVFYNMGALDTADFDSLSYSWTHPLRAYNQNVSFSGSFAYNNPLTVYNPPGFPFPFHNPGSNPPIGIYLDPLTGDLIFTPTNCSEVAVFAIKVTEWRDNAAGVPEVVGTVTRDIQIAVTSCPGNKPPVVNGPFSYSVCEGNQLCFNISTNDLPFIPPPPAPIPALDTVQLYWNNGISGASFTILNDTTRLKTGRFCWTPPMGSASSVPYSFTATAEDDNCPLKGVTSRGFRVFVKSRAMANVVTSKVSNDTLIVESQLDSSTISGSAGFFWSLRDSLGNTVFDTSILRFVSSNGVFSVAPKDTLVFKRNANFFLRLELNNLPQNCPSIFIDTLTVDSVLETLIEFPNDTLVCAGSSVYLSTTTNFALAGAQYQWFKNDSILIGDTFSSLLITNIARLEDAVYSIRVADGTGSSNEDKVRIRAKDNYDNSFLTTYEACLGDSINLQIDSIFNGILWSNGSTNFEQFFSTSNIGWVSYSDSFLCDYTDTLELVIHQLPVPSLSDTSSCDSALTLSSGTFNSYSWSNGSSSETLIVTSSGSYSINVLDSNGCSAADTANVQFWMPEEVNLGDDTAQCGGSITLTTNVQGSQVWSTGDTVSTVLINTSGQYSIISSDINGCLSQDTIQVDLYSAPTQDWADTISFCSDANATLSSKPFASYVWSTGDTTQSTSVANSGFYSVVFHDNQGCSNTDSIFVQIIDLPNITLGNDTALCGDSLLLSIAPGNSYTWSTGDTLSFTSINTSGDYWLQLTDSNGCTASDTVNITFNSNTNIPVLTRVGDSIASNLSGTHFWFLDDAPTADANTNSLGVNNRIGNFTAMHQDTNGCVSDTSNRILRTAATSRLSYAPLKVYPNPTSGKVTIDATALGNIRSIKLYETNGKLIENTQAINGAKVNLTWEARNGVYWVVVETSKGVYRAEVVSVR